MRAIKSPLVHSPAYATALIVNALLLVGQVMVHDEYPGEGDCTPRAVIVVLVGEPATMQPAVVHALVVDAVHVFSMHVCADPEAAVAESVYPVLQLLQSTVEVSHKVPPDPVGIVGVPPGQVQELASHDMEFLKMNVFLAPYAPTIANSDDMATLIPNQLSPVFLSKLKAAVVPHVPPVFLKMKALLAPYAPTIANSDDMATLHPN